VIGGKEMKKRSIIQAVAAIVGVFVLALPLFVAYRARAFHYCVDDGERPQVRVVSNDEPCSPDEGPIEWGRMGWQSKVKVLGNTAAKAFSPGKGPFR
jgi:hypothetical protein